MSTPLEQVRFTSGLETLSPEEALARAREILPGEALFLLERPERFRTGRLADFPADGLAGRLGSCIVFDAHAEMRMEPDSPGSLACRIITEGPDGRTEAWARRTSFRIRAHAAAEPLLGAGGSLRHTEYFVEDAESGMPVLKAERLGGPDSRADGTEVR